MDNKKRIAVFCGSSIGHEEAYKSEAVQLAKAMTNRQYGLVYGGGSIGLMGTLADSLMELGEEVIGVIPQKIYDWEVGHTGITQLHVVKNMHERKAMMAELADAFIALPGGIGTLEEIIEIITWRQLGYHKKPCVFINTSGYYNKLFDFLNDALKAGFLKPTHQNNWIVADNADEAINYIAEKLGFD